MEKDLADPKTPEEHPTEEEIDRTLKESFPASDPPGWTLGVEPTHPPKDESEEEKE